MAEVVGRVLALASERMTASAVLELLAGWPVQARFGLEHDDLDRVLLLLL